jgi:hypothetical protein
MCNVEDLFLDIKYDLKLEEKIVYNDYFVLYNLVGVLE